VDTLRPDIAGVALLARHARRALNALRSRGANCTGWTRDALDTLRASLARRTGWTALASVALRSSDTGNALRSCNASGTRDTGNPLRAYIAAIPLYARCTSHACWTLRPDASSCARGTSSPSHAGDALRSRHASHTLRTSGSRVASRTRYTRRSLRTSNTGHALRSLRPSKANLRPRCEITSKTPELAVSQRQHQHPRFTPQLRDRVTLCRIGDAAVSALAVPCLVRGVRVRRVKRHDRREYVSAFNA
jgi:hypothetical protein